MQTVNRHIYLASKQSCFNQYQVEPTCNLCSAAPETRQHFVAECSVFEIERNIFKQRMANYTASCIDQQDPDTFTRLVLDPSAMVKPTVADEVDLHRWNCTPESTNSRFTKKKRVAKLKHILTS